jgi:hypothetical protein
LLAQPTHLDEKLIMATLNQTPSDAVSSGSLTHRHFGVMPLETQRVTVRRLVLSGLQHEEIAARTGWSSEAVRRFIAEDQCLVASPLISDRLRRMEVRGIGFAGISPIRRRRGQLSARA